MVIVEVLMMMMMGRTKKLVLETVVVVLLSGSVFCGSRSFSNSLRWRRYIRSCLRYFCPSKYFWRILHVAGGYPDVLNSVVLLHWILYFTDCVPTTLNSVIIKFFVVGLFLPFLR